MTPNGIVVSYTVYCGEALPGAKGEDEPEADLSGSGSGSGSNSPLTPGESGSGTLVSSTGGTVEFPELEVPEVTANYTIKTEVGANETYVYIQQLTPFQEYECYVAANTSVGQGNQSSLASAVTDESSKLNSVHMDNSALIKCAKQSNTCILKGLLISFCSSR